MGITASAGAKAISHTFSLVLTFAILTNLLQYYAWKGVSKRGTNWQRFGPALLIGISIPLICADMIRHTLQDSGIWDGPSSHMYRPNCSPVQGLHGILCLSVTGWLFTIVFTYSGFILLIVSVVKATNIHKVAAAAWRDIRKRRRGTERRNLAAGVPSDASHLPHSVPPCNNV